MIDLRYILDRMIRTWLLIGCGDVGQQRVRNYTQVSGLVWVIGISNTGEKIHLRESRNIEYEESMGILMELPSI